MDLDIRTLFIAHSAVSIALGALMLVFWRTHRNMRGIGQWTLGTVFLGLITIGGGLRGILPDFLTIIAANCFGLAGLAAFWNGIRMFNGDRARWGGALGVMALAAAFLMHRTYVQNDILDRIVVMSFILSAACFLCAFELLRGPARTLRGTALPAAALFGLVGLLLAARAASAAFLPSEPDAFAQDTTQSTQLIISLVSNILVVVALLMMAVQRLERQVKSRNADLEIARNRAEEASRAKSEFLATMSHELRTPLNAILGFSDLLRLEVFGPLGQPRYREYAKDIHASGTHLLDLITTILDISKAEAGRLEIEPVSVKPGPIVETAARLVRGAADTKRIRLSLDLPDAPPPCFADPQALKQILLNLLSNAVKFTPEGGAVSVRLNPLADGGVEFAIRDTGIGIAASDIPRLMKPFEQVAGGYAQRNGGTGLGLPLVDALVRLHGGTLDMDSTVGEGTTVTVRLPPGPPPRTGGQAPPQLRSVPDIRTLEGARQD